MAQNGEDYVEGIPKSFPGWRAGDVLAIRVGYGVAVWNPATDSYLGSYRALDEQPDLFVAVDALHEFFNDPTGVRGIVWLVVSSEGEVGLLHYSRIGLRDDVRAIEIVPKCIGNQDEELRLRS